MPEQMTEMIASTLGPLHCQIVLVFVIELLHGTFQHSVFIPVYKIGYILIPNIGNDILFQSFKFARLIYTELQKSADVRLPYNAISHHHLFNAWQPDNRLVPTAVGHGSAHQASHAALILCSDSGQQAVGFS